MVSSVQRSKREQNHRVKSLGDQLSALPSRMSINNTEHLDSSLLGVLSPFLYTPCVELGPIQVTLGVSILDRIVAFDKVIVNPDNRGRLGGGKRLSGGVSSELLLGFGSGQSFVFMLDDTSPGFNSANAIDVYSKVEVSSGRYLSSRIRRRDDLQSLAQGRFGFSTTSRGDRSRSL